MKKHVNLKDKTISLKLSLTFESYFERFVAARVRLLLSQSGGLLVGCRQLVPLEQQRLLKLLLRLRLQQLLPEGDVGEEGGKRPAQLHRRLRTFLQKKSELGTQI